ncbi:hypothetical protein [Paludisphaera borealis]|nr:hypothetical protein [Paludisphaera borealis]
MSIFAGGESDFVVVLDGPFEAEVELFSNDSPRTWLKIIRSVIEGYRESLDDDEIGDDGIGFIVPGPSDN